MYLFCVKEIPNMVKRFLCVILKFLFIIIYGDLEVQSYRIGQFGDVGTVRPRV